MARKEKVEVTHRLELLSETAPVERFGESTALARALAGALVWAAGAGRLACLAGTEKDESRFSNSAYSHKQGFYHSKKKVYK